VGDGGHTDFFLCKNVQKWKNQENGKNGKKKEAP
jgi:hypothetical protein